MSFFFTITYLPNGRIRFEFVNPQPQGHNTDDDFTEAELVDEYLDGVKELEPDELYDYHKDDATDNLLQAQALYVQEEMYEAAAAVRDVLESRGEMGKVKRIQ